MKIAFDGTVLQGRKSGVGYYTQELLRAMLDVDREHQFVLFSHQPVQLEFQPAKGKLGMTHAFRCPVRAFYLHALLPRVLDRIQPDLCHYTNFLAPISDRRPYVVTIHDMGMEALRHCHPITKRVYTRQLVPYVARKARLVITNSEYSKWDIVRWLAISEDRIRVTPLAPSPEFAPVPVAPARPYFLYVGNLEPRKNLERLLEAFAQMPRKEHELIIAGNRWYGGNAVREKARALGLNGRVKFIGYVPRADLPALYSGAAAFVYPSLLEGFGLPVVEAMACGAPVITSNTSAMKEIADGAALLVDPKNVRNMTEALTRLAENDSERAELSRRGLARSAEFSWEKTARLTLDAYSEAVDGISKPRTCPATAVSDEDLERAIRRTIDYSKHFQYPLLPEEIRERLFGLKVEREQFNAALDSMRYAPDRDLMIVRAERERISDAAIRELQPHLRTLASVPFVRMVAFSGSTAHRNMSTAEDVDLFIIVEDGKLWAAFLAAMVWAKLKGLRKRLCMNYLLSDAALPLYEHDAFTAQQAASLKPIYGKVVYDRFINANPFVGRCFPNFNAARCRDVYPELEVAAGKKLLESLLRAGPVQVLERAARYVLGRHLTRKINADSDVRLDPHRLKLHLHSHKGSVLRLL